MNRCHLSRTLTFAIAVAVAVAVGACHSSSPTPAQAAGAVQVDGNRVEAERLIAALAAGKFDEAELRFSAQLKASLPPATLAAAWRSLVARHGAFKASRVVSKDDQYGAERYALKVDFAVDSVRGLVVFEPKTAEVIGFFFLAPPPKAAPATEPAIASADPFVEEVALTVGAPPIALGASLTLPRDKANQRLPAVLLVPGSGPRDRDETIQGAKPFHDIARGLAERGIASLRFDKRTLVHPQRFPPQGTVEEEVLADSVLAAAVLRARPEVDPARFFVLGHSLGALLAPEIAERSGGAAGLILIAAPGRPLPELIIEQLRVHGESPSKLALLTEKVRVLSQLSPDEQVLGMPACYWQDLARRDEVAAAKRLGAPVLYLRGEADNTVFPADMAAWTRELSASVSFEGTVLPGLNHLLLPANAHLTGGGHVPSTAITRVVDFIHGFSKGGHRLGQSAPVCNGTVGLSLSSPTF